MRVLITGGSSGIGLASAEVLAREGARVALLAHGEEGPAAAARRLRDQGFEVETIAADVTEREALTTAVERASELLGGLDLLVTAAASLSFGAFVETDPDDFDATIATVLGGTVDTIRAALPHLERSGGGLIAIGSTAVVGQPRERDRAAASRTARPLHGGRGGRGGPRGRPPGALRGAGAGGAAPLPVRQLDLQAELGAARADSLERRGGPRGEHDPRRRGDGRPGARDRPARRSWDPRPALPRPRPVLDGGPFAGARRWRGRLGLHPRPPATAMGRRGRAEGRLGRRGRGAVRRPDGERGGAAGTRLSRTHHRARRADSARPRSQQPQPRRRGDKTAAPLSSTSRRYSARCRGSAVPPRRSATSTWPPPSCAAPASASDRAGKGIRSGGRTRRSRFRPAASGYRPDQD
jgi:hypothetical protein